MAADERDPHDLLTAHSGRIRALVRRLAADDDAADLEQEVYVAALERPPKHRAALPAWLATTVRNLAAKRFRGGERRRRREEASAPREAQTSTAELVARVELEEFLLHCVRELAEPEREAILLRFFEGLAAAAIAARLQIGESTVRARLVRALVRLRERLDAKHGGDRAAWIALLLPGSAKVAAAGAAGVAAGILVMNWKLAGAAAVVLAATAWIVAPSTRRAGSRVSTVSSSAPASGERTVPPPPPSPASARAADPDRIADRAPESTTKAAGGAILAWVRLAVVDSATARPIDPFFCRGLSTFGFLKARGEGELAFGVAPAAWDLAILAKGYEPDVRRGLDLIGGKTLDLGTIGLHRGTGSITGVVRSETLPADARRYVELRGDGRSPCPRCGSATTVVDPRAGEVLRELELRLKDPANHPTREDFESLRRKQVEAGVLISPCCGYEEDLSLFEVDAHGRFEFDGLAAGTYFVRALDADLRPQPTLRVELARGERRDVGLELERAVMLTADLVDADGQPFAGAWKNDWSEETEVLHFQVDIDGVAFAFDATPQAEDVRGRLGSPPRLGAEPPPDPLPPPAPAPLRIDLPALARPGAQPPAADESRRLEPLLPEPSPPPFAGIEVGIARLAPDRYLLTHLPPARMRVSASCGARNAAAVEVDLHDPAHRRVCLVFGREEK